MNEKIENLLEENRIFDPSEELKKNAHPGIKSPQRF